MKSSLRGTATTALILGTLALTPAVALAPPIVVPTKDPSPAVVTTPRLINPTQIVKIREDALVSNTPVRIKVYPDNTGYRPTNGSCQGSFTTPARKTGSNHKVVIQLNNSKKWCKGLLYQAQALIGSKRVPDKFAHLCVRGDVQVGFPGCQSNPYYGF